VIIADRSHRFAIDADAPGLHAERSFTLHPAPNGAGTVVVSHETQVGLLPWLCRWILGPRLHAANQACSRIWPKLPGNGRENRRSHHDNHS
jgi:hypothetical protein